MNKISQYGPNSFGLTPAQFKTLVRFIFDDPFDIKEEYHQYSECLVTLGAEIGLEVAKECLECVVGNIQIKPEDLVGTWMCDTSRDDGIRWDDISEIQKCHQVTETKIVTTWKPICENSPQTPVAGLPRIKE